MQRNGSCSAWKVSRSIVYWVLKSTDAGLTWESFLTELEPDWTGFRVLYVNPMNPNLVYGDIGRLCMPPCAWSPQLLISEDGGRNWRSFMDGMAGVDFSDLTFHPKRPEEIYACTKNGIYMTSSVVEVISGVLPVSMQRTTWGYIRLETFTDGGIQ